VVDTGLGLERLCALMQGCQSAYDTDLFQPLIGRISEVKFNTKNGIKLL
jgi:alanyl-tRNA synthetase